MRRKVKKFKLLKQKTNAISKADKSSASENSPRNSKNIVSLPHEKDISALSCDFEIP